MIIYVHGFRSSGESSKADVLSQHFPDSDVRRPDLPTSPREAIKLLEELIEGQSEQTMLVGSSLGGFYSLYLAAKHPLTAVLLNPSLAPWRTLADSVGRHERIHSDDTFLWKREYNDALAVYGQEIDTAPSFAHRLHFFLAEDDELLDHSSVPTHYAEAATIEYFKDCTHRFTRFLELVPKLKEIYGGLQ